MEELIYFDNSTTALVPKELIEKMKKNIECVPSSYARGTNSAKITREVEKTRKLVAEFIKAKSSENIAFTAGATYSSNTIAYSYCLHNLEEGDEILLCDNDHKSTILPFYNIVSMLKSFGKNIKIENIEIDNEGDYNEEALIKKVNSRTKIIVLTHIHNTYGLEMNIKYIVEEVRKINSNVKIILDASQSIGHIDVDVSYLNVDMAYFSGHKMMSMQGVGILYIKDDIEKFKPFIIGGNASEQLDLVQNISSVKDLENGSINSMAIISLKDAMLWINEIGIENVEKKIYELSRYLYEKLKEISLIEFNKGIAKCSCDIGYGIISFKVDGKNSSEIGEILKDYNIIVRTGKFCTRKLDDDYIRVSLYYYNSIEEIDKFIKVLKYIIFEM